jgi:hypothetical protein
MFRKRVDPDNAPNQFNIEGYKQFKSKDTKLVEGDIAAPKTTGRNAYIKNPKWPNGVVPYEINTAYSKQEKKVITDALAAISKATNNCIKFSPRTTKSTTWVSVFPGSG